MLSSTEFLRVYYASTTLRLHQPPPVEASVLKGLSESLTTITPGVPSTIDTFYRAKLALEGFFDSFFALPTEFWTVMPVFTMLHNLCAITMLARWAKVMGPGRSRASTATADILVPQKVIWDPSAQKPLPARAMFGAGMAPAPSFDSSTQAQGTAPAAAPRSTERNPPPRPDPSMSSKPPMDGACSLASRLADIPPPIVDPAQIPAAHIREAADPAIPRLVAALKAGLHAQPGLLNLDIIGILSTLARRCDEVHQRLLETSAGGSGAWQNDVWYLSGKKVLIARAKLEKWAEIIAAGGVVAGPGPAPDQHNKAQPQSLQPVPVSDALRDQGDSDVRMGNTPGPVDEVPSVAGASPPANQWQQHYPEEEAMAAFQREMENAAQGILPPEVMHDADMYGGVWMDGMFDPLDPSLWLNDGGEWGMALFGPSQDMHTGS